MVYKIIIPVVIIACVTLFVMTDISESIFGKILESYMEPNWDEVKERNIVKNTIPIYLLESIGLDCKVRAEHFYQIVDQAYFINAEQLANELQYDQKNNTLIVSCDELKGEKSRLHVWYAVSEALRHAEKYQYFITEWES